MSQGPHTNAEPLSLSFLRMRLKSLPENHFFSDLDLGSKFFIRAEKSIWVGIGEVDLHALLILDPSNLIHGQKISRGT